MPPYSQTSHTNTLLGAHLSYSNWKWRSLVHIPMPHGLYDPRYTVHHRFSICKPTPKSKLMSGLWGNTQSPWPMPTQYNNHWLHRHSDHCPHKFTQPNSMYLSLLQYQNLTDSRKQLHFSLLPLSVCLLHLQPHHIPLSNTCSIIPRNTENRDVTDT